MFEDESPETTVELSEFAIDRDAVTNREFSEFILAGGYANQELWTAAGWRFISERGFSHPSCWEDEVWGVPEMPVTGLSWWEASAFATWRGAALPSEAQWEAACRCRSGGLYPWGDDAPTLAVANYAPSDQTKTGIRMPCRADAFAANVSWAGCNQMAGNLAEWCVDVYDIQYRFEAGQVDPVWLPDETQDHVTRGGSSLHSEEYMRCTARDPYPPGLRDNFLGVRCVSPPRQES